jgi:hypothetical protein
MPAGDFNFTRSTGSYPVWLYPEDLGMLDELASLFGCRRSEAFRTCIRHGLGELLPPRPDVRERGSAVKYSAVLRPEDIAIARYLAAEDGVSMAETLRRSIASLYDDTADYRRSLKQVPST